MEGITFLLGLLGLPTIVGSFVLALRYMKLIQNREDKAIDLKKLELEIAQRNTELREKEVELEVKRLAFDIQSLEQRESEQKKLS